MRRATLLVLCALTMQCTDGGTPTAPTPPGAPEPAPTAPVSNLPLQPGPQLLSVVGFGLSDNPLYPACSPVLVPHDGPNVDTLVTLERDGEIRGSGVDAGTTPPGTVHDVRVAFANGRGGDATVEGELTAPLTGHLNGRIAGVLSFSDKVGNTATCSAIIWSLQPDRHP
jgi:hypothetical protein